MPSRGSSGFTDAIQADMRGCVSVSQQPRASPGSYEGDDLVFSEGSGCFDSDDDDCGADGFGSGDDLITAVYVQPTARPAPSPPPVVVTHGDCDDEDCLDGGSGSAPDGEDDDDSGDGASPTPPDDGFSSSSTTPSTTAAAPTATPSTTQGAPPAVISVPIPELTVPDQERARPAPKLKSSADSTALVIGVIAGILISIVIVALLVYQFRSRPAGAYKVEQAGAAAVATGGASKGAGAQQGEAYQPVATAQQLNGAVQPKAGNGAKRKKDLREWYV
ncbi:hypothetical protein MTO96_028517 [Rhipicephalus appendiculatus]